MRIGVYVPVGPLKRLSYQYQYEPVLENLTHHFDWVTLVSQSRETTQDCIKGITNKNLSLISDSSSWFSIEDGQKEHIIFGTADKTFQLAKEELLLHDIDILVLIDINMYVRSDQIEEFKNYCRALIENDEPIGHRYRSLQTKESFSVPNIRHPWVFNAKHEKFNLTTLEADEAYINGDKLRAERGQFTDAPYYFCDLFPPIMTEKDYNEKYEYYIKYLNEYYSNKGQDKDWFNYIRREYNKYKSSPLMHDVELDDWGKKMIENIPDHSIYDYFDLLEGNTFDRLKFKLLEYKYRLSV